jgi:hypothetical protein
VFGYFDVGRGRSVLEGVGRCGATRWVTTAQGAKVRRTEADGDVRADICVRKR